MSNMCEVNTAGRSVSIHNVLTKNMIKYQKTNMKMNKEQTKLSALKHKSYR